MMFSLFVVRRVGKFSVGGRRGRRGDVASRLSSLVEHRLVPELLSTILHLVRSVVNPPDCKPRRAQPPTLDMTESHRALWNYLVPELDGA